MACGATTEGSRDPPPRSQASQAWGWKRVDILGTLLRPWQWCPLLAQGPWLSREPPPMNQKVVSSSRMDLKPVLSGSPTLCGVWGQGSALGSFNCLNP